MNLQWTGKTSHVTQRITVSRNVYSLPNYHVAAECPLLNQLTASTSEDDNDSVDTYYLNPLDFEGKTGRPLYPLEYLMGMNYRELHLEMSVNTVHVRSSVKKLLQEQTLALIPTEKTLDKLLQLHSRNLECKVYDRIHYTDVLPHQEYEYRVRSIDPKGPISIISSDGSRQSYQFLYEDLPHFRSTMHPFLVISSAASILFAAATRDIRVKDVKVMEMWFKSASSVCSETKLEGVRSSSRQAR